MSFKFIDHTADIAVDIEAGSLEELFTDAAESWRESLLEDSDLNLCEEREIVLEEDSIEELLKSFLDEINFLFNVKKWISGKVKSINIEKKEISGAQTYKLQSVILGEEYNEVIHDLKTEIKAVTFHQMEVKEDEGVYSTRIVYDI